MLFKGLQTQQKNETLVSFGYNLFILLSTGINREGSFNCIVKVAKLSCPLGVVGFSMPRYYTFDPTSTLMKVDGGRASFVAPSSKGISLI